MLLSYIFVMLDKFNSAEFFNVQLIRSAISRYICSNYALHFRKGVVSKCKKQKLNSYLRNFSSCHWICYDLNSYLRNINGSRH